MCGIQWTLSTDVFLSWWLNVCRFDSEVMLNFLRGKRLVFVGDSIGRNQWESLLCMLATGVKNKTRIFEVNGESITKHKGSLIFRFQAYNCTIEYYRSPFLVPQGSPPHDAPKSVQCTLKVDTIDWASNQWLGADILVFNTGHWWSYEKTLKVGCYFQVGGDVNKSMSVRDGLARAIQTWKRWVAFNIDSSKASIFLCTYTPVHFSGGTWKKGGRCNMETEPYKEGTRLGRESWTNRVILEEVATLRQSVRLLDITHLSNYRKDAHPSIYYRLPTEDRPLNHQDCSHWCLPGLPDIWNQILYASLLYSAP
ncbi:hypothetical protein KP509_35G011400 [Ceratopteris richardii]|uniref:Trichome birefringence-like C-terminal domain-containing protein n=1 Tax=Ceratopteris richardii TaxID=49495 RepID=A0A8T2QEH8_CERRI|nr:hypothetical protein KP509_35G011400 [Ceratopteris richardii]